MGDTRQSQASLANFCGFIRHTSLAINDVLRKDNMMNTRNRLLPLLSLALLSACVVPTGPVEVTRFNRASEGVVYGTGSVSVVVAGDTDAGQGLSASPYVAAVERELQRVGYSAKNMDSEILAEIRYAVTTVERERRSPVSVGVGGSTSSFGSGLGVGIGINLGGGSSGQVETTLAVRLVRRSDKLVIWEGKASQMAKAGSPAAQPGIAAAKLAEAMFKGFPGVSGETIRVP